MVGREHKKDRKEDKNKRACENVLPESKSGISEIPEKVEEKDERDKESDEAALTICETEQGAIRNWGRSSIVEQI